MSTLAKRSFMYTCATSRQYVKMTTVGHHIVLPPDSVIESSVILRLPAQSKYVFSLPQKNVHLKCNALYQN